MNRIKETKLARIFAWALFLGVVVAGSYMGHKYYSFGGGHRRNSGREAIFDPKAVAED